MSREFLDGLRALTEAAFPKHCRNCGKIYLSAEEFLQETVSARSGHSGLKQGHDDDEMAIVEAYRNCLCGSTLMDYFSNRRDVSAEGDRRRLLFGLLLWQLEEEGMNAEEAREHILKLLRGDAEDGPY